MATTFNGYMRETIKTALDTLTDYDADLNVLYYLDFDKLPMIYVRVENQKDNYPSDWEGRSKLINGECDYMLAVTYKVQVSKTNALELSQEAENWIKYIDYKLRAISLPLAFTDTITLSGSPTIKLANYSIYDITNESNVRTFKAENDSSETMIIRGKIKYDKTYLI